MGKAKRAYKNWIRERVFPNAMEAEKAILEEGCWSYRFKNNTYEGIKKYYECKYGKRRKKKCAQELHLMFLNTSQHVHLFRTNSEHTHSISRGSEMPRRVIPSVPPVLRPVPVAEEIPLPPTMPKLAIIKTETLEEPFDVSESDEYAMDVPMDFDVHQDLAPKCRRTQRNWIKVMTFCNQQGALDFVRQEGCWGYRFSNTTLYGVKNYFRCNLTRTRGKQCAQEIYLEFEKHSPRVHLFRTNCEHTHDSIVNEYNKVKIRRQFETFGLDSVPSTSHSQQEVEFIPIDPTEETYPGQSIKAEPSDTSSEASFAEGFINSFDVGHINQALHEPHLEIFEPRLNRLKPVKAKGTCLKDWVKEQIYPNAEEAEQTLKEEACWSYRFKNNTAEGVKKYFRCNLAKRRGAQCAQEVHLMFEANSERVILYRTRSDHTHDENEAQGKGISPIMKDEIIMLYRNHTQKPKDIFRILHKSPRRKLPSLRQVSNFILHMRKKEEMSQAANTSDPSDYFDIADVVIKSEPEDSVQLFSSGDLSSECEDGGELKDAPPGARPPPLQQQPLPTGGPPNIPPPPAPGTAGGPPMSAGTNAPELSLSFGKGPARGTSAPASPAKSRESLLQRVQSLTGAARDQGASIIGAAVSSATRPAFNKDRCLTLLVLDDQNTDWSKYFRGKRLHGDYDIRVEQAEFCEISLTASAEAGTVVTMAVVRGGTKVARSFKPDFVLVRQPPRDGARDSRSTLLGLKYGSVPSINSLSSLYQFQDKPWVFAHLLQLQKRLGRDIFPLIEQTFFPNPRELFSWQKFPCVLKAGHCHGGTATARLDNQTTLQDSAGLLCGSGNSSDSQCYCTLEPYIDAKFDIHIQKIGGNYKAFMRKSISGHWKTNQGSAMLEQIAMTDRYKSWIDEISELFGGMEVCGLSVGVSKDGKEYILSAQDSTFPLMGDSQEEDRRHIADLVVGRMQNVCRPPGLSKTQSRTSISSRSGSAGGSPTEETAGVLGSRSAPAGAPPPIPERTTPGVGSIGRHGSLSSTSDIPDQPTEKAPTLSSASRRDSQTSQTSNVSATSGASRPAQRAQSQSSVVEDAEDTMKNLRKTFAGIFGDM